MEFKLRYAFAFALMGIGLAVAIIWAGGVGDLKIKGTTNYTVDYTFLTATTTTAVSTNVSTGQGYANIEGAKKVTFAFKRGDTTGQGNTGTSAFSVQITHDGTNWYNYGNLLSATSTEATPYSSYGITAATTTDFLSMDLTNDSFYGVRVTVTETTDGEHSASAKIEF